MHLMLPNFDTLSDENKVPYLKIDPSRYFYQRRVPQKMQAHLGIRWWQLPCGDVNFYEMTKRLEGEEQIFPKHAILGPWQAAAKRRSGLSEAT